MRSAINLRIINESAPNCYLLICRKVRSGFLFADSPNLSQLHDNRSLINKHLTFTRAPPWPADGQDYYAILIFKLATTETGLPVQNQTCDRIIDDLTFCVQTLAYFYWYIPCF